MKVYEIVPGKLYQSKKTNDESEAEKVRLFEEFGITIIVNLWHTVDEDLVDCAEYIHFPIPDGILHNAKPIEELASKLASSIESGECVLSHCYGGRNRSGLLNALIVRKLLRIPGKESVEFIRSRRPNSLVNKKFVAYLESLP